MALTRTLIREFAHKHRFTLWVFMFVVFVGLLIGYRNERHDDELEQALRISHQNAKEIQDNYAELTDALRTNCEARVANTRRFNAALDAVARSALQSEEDPAERARIIRQMEGFKLHADDCNRYPPRADRSRR